jgi:type IV pilus assembly protein PilC
MQYKYEIQDSAGRPQSGVIDASSMDEATTLLRNRGYLLNLTPVTGGAGGDFLAKLRSVNIEAGPGLKDILNFTNQLAVMIKAGINIRNAVANIASQTKSVKFRGMISTICNDIESGKSFSDALSRYPGSFSPLYINMVKASELSGNFGHMLGRISQYLGQQIETRAMVKGAMIYPCIIATMAVTTVIFMLTFVLPTFTKMFAGKEDLLPAPTKILMAISDFLRNDWYILIGAVIAMIVGIIMGLRTPIGAIIWDTAKLRIPVMGKMFKAMYISRGLQTMGELVNAGVPMLETLSITAAVSGNSLYRNMWDSVKNAVKEGSKIATPLMKQNLLPMNVVQMITAGEESGKLGEVLRDVSDFYAAELKNAIKMATSMIEPLMIVLMGGIVGFIVAAMILPVFKMTSMV